MSYKLPSELAFYEAFGRGVLDSAIRLPGELEVKQHSISTELPEREFGEVERFGRIGTPRANKGFGGNRKGYLGLPVFNFIKLSAGKDSILLADVLITIRVNKTIVKTSVAERQGTVKEIFGVDDYGIQVQGVICSQLNSSESRQYPTADVKKLVSICNQATALKVSSSFLNDVFGIQQVVIEDANFDAVAGFTNWQKYSLNMVSDLPSVLYLK